MNEDDGQEGVICDWCGHCVNRRKVLLILLPQAFGARKCRTCQGIEAARLTLQRRTRMSNVPGSLTPCRGPW